MKLESNLKIKIASAVFCLTLVTFLPRLGHAQTIIENHPLTFGKFVLSNNNAQHEIMLQQNGTFIADPSYIFFEDPQLATITVEDYAPLQPLFVTVGTTVLLPSMGGGANFSVSDSFTVPEVIITDANGSATFDVGASLTSNGNGNIHSDSRYQGTYNISVIPTF